MAPSLKQNKKGKITGIIEGLMTTINRPIRPIRACRLNNLIKNATTFDYIPEIKHLSTQKGTFNNGLENRKFEFRRTLRPICPKCYTKMGLKDLRVNIKIKDNFKMGHNGLGYFSQYAIVRNWERINDNIDYAFGESNKPAYADIEEFKLHGAGLPLIFFCVGCPACSYKQYIFNNSGFPLNILSFRKYKVGRTVKIIPEITPFRYTQSPYREEEEPIHQLAFEMKGGPKLIYKI